MRSRLSLLLFLTIFGCLSGRVVEKRSKHVRIPRRLQTGATAPAASASSNSTANPAAASSNATAAAADSSAAAKNDTVDEFEPPGTGSCRPDLLKAFGFSGLATPIKATLDMCPSITDSCCSVADQQVIFQNWDKNVEGANLEKKFANYTETISKFFEAAAKVTKFANDLVKPVAGATPNECGLMARRILTYQIEDSSAVLNDMFARTYSFLHTSHKGLYCSLCNAKNGDFFATTGLKTTISERFCRDLVVTSLPSALYLNSHFPRYINLLNLFVASCDHKGQFIKGSVPPAAVATIDTSNEKSLKDCFDNRNTDNWATSCVSVCESFQIGMVTPMFTPKPSLYKATTDYLVQRIGEIQAKKDAEAAETGSATAGAQAGNSTANATAAAGASASATPAPTNKVRLLREKSIPKRKTRGLRREGRYERRLPRRLQNNDAQTTPAPSNATANNGTNGTAAGGQWASGSPSSPSNQAAAKSAADAAAALAASPKADPMNSLIYNSFNKASGINIEGFTSSVRVFGIHFFEAGLFSDIKADKLKSLRALLKVRKLKSKSHSVRKLNSAGIIGAMASLLMLWVGKN